jgi:uncharacterized protein
MQKVRMKRKILWTLFGILVLGGVAGYVATRPQPADVRYSGAYALEDGSFVFISPAEDGKLRFRTLAGESAALWPVSDHMYEGGRGWAERAPLFNRFSFETDDNDRPQALVWEQSGNATRHAPLVPLREKITTFGSGNLTLRGKLVMPQGAGPHPAVVLVHGSGAESAVDYYFEPYLYAASGFATLVFDKRGTGESQGAYTQNFRVLAADVLAGIKWLREQPDIDGDRIHLAGFSQGGWIAPLAAARDGNIRSVLIGYGPMVPVLGEDRWGYVYALRQKGFGDDAIAKADRISSVISDIMDRGQNRWHELGTILDESRGEPWFEAVKGSDSALGMVSATRLPLWMIRLGAWWKLGRQDPPFIDRLYDPVPTAAALTAPSFWIFGGADSSMPTEWTIDELRKLQARRKPVDYVIYPDADHGILRFSTDNNGDRHVVGYEPDYFKIQIDWLRRHNGKGSF